MENNNKNQNQITKNTKFSAFLTNDAIKNRINELVGTKDGQRFITAIISAVSTNETLANCEHGSILSAALLGESLKLSPSPQLGHYYLVPYAGKAQFQIGYKGYLQLAIRSGQYKKINVLAIKAGELINYDPLTEGIEVNLISDELARETAKTIGYYAMFEYLNGFKKSLYWSREKMESHANTYSKGYKAKKGYTFWEKDFDAMAYKTMLRQLLSKWGVMSIEMQRAYEYDMAEVKDNGDKNYIDNKEDKEITNPFASDEAIDIDTDNLKKENITNEVENELI